MLDSFSLKVQFSARCDTGSESKPLTTHQRTAAAVIGTALVLVAIGTVIDVAYGDQLRNKATATKITQLSKFLSNWSMIQSTKRLFARPVSESDKPQLLAVHGIKVLTILWIMVTHTYLFGGFYHALWLYKKLGAIIEVPSKFWFQGVFNGWVLVDTFFFLSGVLLVYTMLPLLDKTKGRASFALYVIHRLVRLLPAMVGALSIHFLWPLLFRGPAMLDNEVHDYMVASCEQNWWTNLLFLSNWVEPSKMVSKQYDAILYFLHFQ